MEQQAGPSEKKVNISNSIMQLQSDVKQVYENIEVIKKGVEEIQVKILGTSADRDCKENAKKFKSIRKFLTTKIRPETPSKVNLWNKLKNIRRHRGVGSEIFIEPTPSELIEMFELSQESNPFFSYSIDEAFFYGAECMLALINTLKESQ